MSFPSSPSTESDPAFEQMTSSLVVPVSVSSAAVPVIVHSVRAPATPERTPCANTGPTINPSVAADTKMPRSFMENLPRAWAPVTCGRRLVGKPTGWMPSGASQIPRIPYGSELDQRFRKSDAFFPVGGSLSAQRRHRMGTSSRADRPGRATEGEALNSTILRLSLAFPLLVAAFVTAAPVEARAADDFSATSVALATLHTRALTDAGGVQC